METEKAIPTGYMTVGEVAQKMGVTVRTLQYYDREGLLTPSAISEGGRRLYTDRDLIQLHQILSLKHLGFSLGDIKNRLIPLDTPEDVAKVLDEQATALRTEVLQMKTVDFKKYADIIVNLQMKNDFYWLIKHFDEPMLDHIRSQFDQRSGTDFLQTFLTLQDRAIALGRSGVAPDSAEGLAFAQAYWDMILTFTGGDLSMLPQLIELGQAEGMDPQWRETQTQANAFIGPALDAYFSQNGIAPFPEEGEP